MAPASGGPSAGAPSAAGAPAGAVIGFARWREPHEQVWIGLSGVDEIPAGLRPTHSGFDRRERVAELRALALTYAPFRLRTAEWDLVFLGRGPVAAGLAEQRMALEWTRHVMVEAAGGGGGESYGLVFSWHRGVAGGGLCDEVAVFLDGEVRAGPCPAGLPGREARGRLTAARLARLYAWYDGLQAFQADGLQGVRPDAPFERVVFAGRGGSAPRSQEVAAIGELAAQLYRELTAPPPPPQPAAVEPRLAEKAGASRPSGEEAAAGTPAGEKSAGDEQAQAEPMVQQRSEEGRAGEEPAAQQPVDERPAAEKPAVAKQAAEEQPEEKPALKDPATKEPDKAAAKPAAKARAKPPGKPPARPPGKPPSEAPPPSPPPP